MKKMTAKEFKEILEMANINSDFVMVLTNLANHEYDQAQMMRKNGFEAGARSYEESFLTIVNELKDRGYATDEI